MHSAYGQRGAICEKFGWDYDYLLEGIGWITVQKMLIDGMTYDYDSESLDEGTDIDMRTASSEELENFLKQFVE